MRADRNDLNQMIPSYIDIEAELQRQRKLVTELKIELNAITNQRDEVLVQFFVSELCSIIIE